MRVLNRYVCRQILVPSLLALLTLTFIALLREVGWIVQVLARQSASVDEVSAVLFAILPQVLRFTIPMALLAGTLVAFSRMSADNEMIALRAAGISMTSFMLPVLVLASVAWTVDLALSAWVAPHTASHLRILAGQILAKQFPFELRAGSFTQGPGNFVLYARTIEPDGERFGDIMVADLSRPHNRSVTFAEHGALRHDALNRTFAITLTDGTTITEDRAGTGGYALLDFSAFTVNLGKLDPPALPASNPAVETATSGLWNRMRSSTATSDERLEFHSRIAPPFACFAFALIGLSLGVSQVRGTALTALSLSAALMVSYYAVFVGGTHVASRTSLSPFLTVWLANIILTAIGAVLFRRSDRDCGFCTPRCITRLADIVTSKTGALLAARNSRLGRRRIGRGGWSMLPTLDVYVLKGFIFYFGLVSVTLIALVEVVMVNELLPDIDRNHVKTLMIVKYVMLSVPHIFYQIAPFRALIGTVIVISIMAASNELTAVKAGGVSLQRVFLPLCVAGVVLSAGLFGLQEYLLPSSSPHLEEYRKAITGGTQEAYGKPQRTWLAGQSGFYSYGTIDAETHVFSDVSVFQLASHGFKLQAWASAKRGGWHKSAFILEDGWVDQRGSNRTIAVEKFDHRSFFTAEAPDDFAVSPNVVSEMTYRELRRYLDQTPLIEGVDLTGARLELHKKLVVLSVPVCMVLVGGTCVLMFGARRAAYGSAASIVVGIAYWSAVALVQKSGGNGWLPSEIALWLPNLFIGLGALCALSWVRT